MKKIPIRDIIYGFIFIIMILGGSYLFSMYYEEKFVKLSDDYVEIKVDNEYWVSGDVTITVNYNDPENKVSKYSFDGGKTWQTSNKYVVEENKRVSIVLKASNGKKTSEFPLVIENIDKENPKVEVKDVVYVEQNTDFDMTKLYKASDSGSGLKGKVTLKPSKIDTTKLGDYDIEVYALDKALNSTTMKTKVSVVPHGDPNLPPEKPVDHNKYVSPTGLSVSPTKVSLVKDSTVQITPTVKPSNATNKKITWKSDNPKIATVDKDGVITGVNAGSTIIRAITEDENKESFVKVTVTNTEVKVLSIELDRKNDLVTSDHQPIKLTATIYPENATNQKVTWTSSDTKVASVNNGIVTIRGEGKATITVETSNNKKATYNITVYDHYTYLIEEVYDKRTGEFQGYALRVYRNGLDITRTIASISSPFSLRTKFTEKNNRDKYILLTPAQYSLIKDSITFFIGQNKYTAYP